MHLSPVWGGFGIVAAAAIAIVAWRLRALTVSGAVAAAIVGSIVMAIGGLAFGLPLVAFFVSASAWSRWFRRSTGSLHPARNAWQVIANGGAATCISLAVVLVPTTAGLAPRDWFLLYLSALAFACGDTWATEIGSKLAKRAWLITGAKWVPAGQSGGISGVGTIAALAGASFVVATGWMAWSLSALDLQWRMDPAEALAVVWAAVVAVMLDSVLGASIQAQYRCHTCARLIEEPLHCGAMAERTRGLRWLTNDAVNFAGSVAAVLFAWYLLSGFAWPA